MSSIFVVGTADTKGDELDYIAACVSAAGGNPLKVDVGTRQPSVSIDISARQVAAAHPMGADAVLASDDRGIAVAAMGEAFSRFIANRTDIAGIIGIGGGGGTSIVSRGMQTLPIGVPKLLVSTLASGDVAPYVGASDIVMMPAITDLAGLNRISRVILGQAGRAIVAMSEAPREIAGGKTAIGLTMFGVTTAGVTQVQDLLNDRFECVVFHATGTGGRTMEALVSNGMLSGVIDLTT
ncbi:MAG TPA: Tm-1-like ATP-binding domain-containing protein, partial [Woeseiaceae bacterium]